MVDLREEVADLIEMVVEAHLDSAVATSEVATKEEAEMAPKEEAEMATKEVEAEAEATRVKGERIAGPTTRTEVEIAVVKAAVAVGEDTRAETLGTILGAEAMQESTTATKAETTGGRVNRPLPLSAG